MSHWYIPMNTSMRYIKYHRRVIVQISNQFLRTRFKNTAYGQEYLNAILQQLQVLPKPDKF